MNNLKLSLAIALVALLCLPTNSFAKDRLSGVRAGFQSAGLYWDGHALGDPIRTFYVGFDNDTKIMGPLHIGSGLQYFQNGAEHLNDANNDRLVLHYLGLPVHLKAKFGPFFALAGASANFKIAQTYKVDGDKMDYSEKLNWFDVPLHAGVGVKVSVIVIEARYYWGMLDTYNDISVKSQYFQIGAGLLF